MSLILRNKTNGIRFWGNSFVAGPQGEILAQAVQHERGKYSNGR